MSVGSISGGYSQVSGQYYMQPPPQQQSIEDVLSELDLDGDGGLSVDESGLTDEQFTAMDIDGDGMLTQDDHEAMMAQLQAQGQLAAAGGKSTDLLSDLDTDGDGEISQEEVDAAVASTIAELDADGDGGLSIDESGLSEEQFSAFDIDGDGVLTQADHEAMVAQQLAQGSEDTQGPPPPKTAEEVVSEQDSDSDGQLSQSEMGLSSTQFDELDTNKDGYVSAEELEAAHEDEMQEKASADFKTNYAMNAYQSQMSQSSMAMQAWASMAEGLSVTA